MRVRAGWQALGARRLGLLGVDAREPLGALIDHLEPPLRLLAALALRAFQRDAARWGCLRGFRVESRGERFDLGCELDRERGRALPRRACTERRRREQRVASETPQRALGVGHRAPLGAEQLRQILAADEHMAYALCARAELDLGFVERVAFRVAADVGEVVCVDVEHEQRGQLVFLAAKRLREVRGRGVHVLRGVHLVDLVG